MDKIACICGTALLLGAAHFESIILGVIGILLLLMSIFVDWDN